MGTIAKFPGQTQDSLPSRLDDPKHDAVARELHLARHLLLPVHGTELNDLIDSVEEALADLAALPDEAASADELVGVSYALMGVKEFLRKLAAAFDAADGGRNGKA